MRGNILPSMGGSAPVRVPDRGPPARLAGVSSTRLAALPPSLLDGAARRGFVLDRCAFIGTLTGGLLRRSLPRRSKVGMRRGEQSPRQRCPSLRDMRGL
jgi:hypothetical protein